jgi:hypothetical protein
MLTKGVDVCEWIIRDSASCLKWNGRRWWWWSQRKSKRWLDVGCRKEQLGTTNTLYQLDNEVRRYKGVEAVWASANRLAMLGEGARREEEAQGAKESAVEMPRGAVGAYVLVVRGTSVRRGI